MLNPAIPRYNSAVRHSSADGICGRRIDSAACDKVYDFEIFFRPEIPPSTHAAQMYTY